MKDWDLAVPAGKLEMAMKTLRTTAAAVDQQWSDNASRDFQAAHMSKVEPNVRSLLDAIGQLADVLDNAQRQCEAEQ